MRLKYFYFLLAVLFLIVAAYFLQPIKKGKGSDSTIKYEPVENWPNLPADLQLGNPTGISIDTNQQIVVYHRADREWNFFQEMPDKYIQQKCILIINKGDGKLINSWGEDLFIMPHGLKVDDKNNIWVTDLGLNQVLKFSHEGKLLMVLGEPRVAGTDSLHFDKPTDIAITKNGSFYVSDGYGNSRIIKFSAEGKYLFEWGQKGDKEGEFNIPHGITLDDNDNVYVADRENHRIQIFDSTGKFIKQLTDNSFGAFCAVAFNKSESKLYAVDDFTFLKLKHRGSDVFVFDSLGKVQTRFGRSDGTSTDVYWYHTLALDKDGNIYVGDILKNTLQKFKRIPSR